MKLKEPYDNKTAAAFGRELLEHLAPYPFGGMPKRDLDCLLFFLLKKHGLIPGDMNRDKAYSLGISESKYKSLLVDSDAKFVGEHDTEESVRHVFEKIKDKKSGVHLEEDTIVFFEEDPVVRAELARAMKGEGFYTDTSFNNEIVKLKAADFLVFAMARKDISKDKIYELLRQDEIDEKSIETFKKSNMNVKEIIQGGVNILKKQDKLGLHTVFNILGYIIDVASAKRHK